MVREIDIAVVEKLVWAFGRAREKCPSIMGVRSDGDGAGPIIKVDLESDVEPEFVTVIDDLVRALSEAWKKCPSITGVRLWGEGFDQVIRVDSDGDESEEVELKFPDDMRLPH